MPRLVTKYVTQVRCKIKERFCELRGPKRNNTLVAMSIPTPQILVSNTILQQKERGLLEKWLILRLGQEM